MCDIKKLSKINSEITKAATSIETSSVYKIMLFGSYARHDNTDESDIDYMVIYDCPKSDVKTIRSKLLTATDAICLNNDVVVSVLIRDKKTFDEQKNTLPLYRNIIREGVAIYG